MSQVRKLLQGNGGIPKTYNLILDGQTFTIDDDQLTQINNEIASLDPRYRAYLGGVSGTIASGAFVGSRTENKISAPALSNLSDKEMEFLKEGKQNIWEAITDSNTYRAKEAINEALNIISRVINSKKKSDSSKSSKNKLSANTIDLDFNTDKDGKRYLGPTYYDAENRVKQVLEHLKLGDASTYDVSDWPDFTNVSGWLNNNYKGDYDAANKYFTDLWAKMRNPGFDEAEDYNEQDIADILKMFNINIDGKSAGDSKKTDVQKQLEADFKDNPKLYDSIKDNFVKDKDGIWRLRPDGVFNLGFDLAPGQGIWFNDDFYKSKLGADLRLLPLKGLTYYNGALYTQDSPILASILNAENGYNQLMGEGRWDEANNIIWSDFTDLQRRVPTRLAENQYNKFLSDNPQYLFSNITGAVKNLVDEDGNPYTLGPDEDIIQYVDLDNPMMVGPYRRYKFDYRVIDKTGNTDKLISKFDEIPRTAAKAFSAWYPRIINSDNEQYNGRYFINVEDQYGNDTDYAFYVNPNDPNDVYFHIPNLKARGVNSTDDVALPPEVAQKLLETKDKWLPNVISNSRNQKAFGQFISKLLQSKRLQSGVSLIPWNPTAYAAFNSDRATLRNLGLDDSDVEMILKAMHEASSKGTAGERIARHRRTPPASINKKGGKIEYISKLANGGISGATNNISDKKNSDKVDVKKVNPNNPAPLTHIGQADWQDADTMDLIALIGDLGSLAAAFVPGANTASAAIGAGSSFSRFGADLARDKDWLSATGGLLLNLTMDAATLLPFAGGLAKDAKVIKSIKNALPTIIKAASVYGLGSAVVESANKIANNESWTTRDVANLINGITAGVGIARSGGFGKSSKKVAKAKDINIKGSDGKSLNLRGEDLSEISSKQELFDLAFKKAKKDNPNLTEDEFVKNFGPKLEALIKDRWTPGWKPKDWTRTSKSKNFKAKTENVKESVTPTGNGLHDWWYGVGPNQFAYRSAIKDNAKQASLVRTTGGAKSKRMVWDGKSWVEVSSKEVPVWDGGWARSSVHSSAGGENPNNLPAVVQEAMIPVQTRQMQTRTVLNPKTSTSTVTRKDGIKVDKNLYDLIKRQSIAVPQLFGPQYFGNEPEHSTLPQHKKGGIIKAQKGYTIRWKWTDANGAQRIDETQYEGAVPPRDILESLLAEERDKRAVWKKTGLEKDSRVLQYPEYEIIYPSSDNTTSVRFESGSGNSQHLLPEIPEIPEGSSSYGLNTNYEVSPYQTFVYSNLNPQNSVGDIIESTSKPTEQKIVKVKTNKQKDFSDLVNVLENLLDKRRNGGVIKAQSGLKFSVPSEIEVPSNLSTDLINKIAYRPNTDWGTYVNGKYTPFGLLGPYPLKYETNAQRYEDARQAFTDAYGRSYNPQSKSYLSEYGKKDVIEQPVEESLPGNETPLPELNDGWRTPTANDAVQDIAAAIGQKIPTKASSSSTVKKNKIDLAGGYDDNISNKTKWINPLISTFRYGLNAWAQRRYTDQAIKAINAGRYNELPVWQNLPVMTNPTLDRQLQQVHLERMAGMKPVTSDLIANNALWNQREAQLYDRENDIYGKQSAFQWDAAREGLNIMNQNLANQVKVANENRAKSAALNSAIEQQKMAFIQMLNQSRQNALLEVQNNVANDRKTLLAYEQNQYNQQLQRKYDSYLRSTYSDAASKYAALDYAERSKYTDLEDYILRNVPGSAEDIANERNKILNNQLQWNRDNALNYDYGILAGKTSKVGNKTYKKGGRVNGTTRYTLDPDERIWVDNNKAAHAGVAKLTDNVIKLILRALK